MNTLSSFHRVAGAALIAAAFSGAASAAPVTYIGADNNATSVASLVNAGAAAASFAAATGALSTITFESALPAGVTISGGSVTSNSGCGAVCGFNTTTGGSNFLLLSGGTTTFSFASGISAFGFYVTGLQSDLVPQQTVTFTDGSSQSINFPTSIGGGGAFIGFTDLGKSISSISINVTNDIVAIDDVKFGTMTAAVPEPSTYALMLAGLGIMGFLARRKKV